MPHVPFIRTLPLVVIAAAAAIGGAAWGQALVPDAPPPAESVQRAVGAAWLTDEERKDLRIAHGVWSDADLDSARRRAMAALITWRLDDPALADPTVPAAWRAEALLRRGRFADALALVEGANDVPAQAIRADALAGLGRVEEARALAATLDPLLDDATDAAAVIAAARAATLRATLEPRESGDYQRTLDALGRIRQVIDRMSPDAPLAEGELLAHQAHEEAAVPALQEALALNPRSSAAWHRLGRMAADSFDFGGAERAAAALERIRPGHPLAALVRASAALTRRDSDEALAVLDRLLAVEPTMPEALALRAAVDATRYDLDGARRWLARLDEVSPGGALGYATVGQRLAENRQYEDAAEFLAEAIRRRPNWSDPHIALGLLETQTGRDDRAIAALREATRLDPFNRRASFSLFLLEEMQSYVRFEGKHFVIRCKPGQDEVVAALMPDALDAMHEVVTGRFRHEPAERTVIDLMPDHRSFGVRITGMPQIHTIAACTGPVIAIEVPKLGPKTKHFGTFDWLKVLRHEYTHTVTLSQTRNRIPHWLTEAAAVSMEFAPRGLAEAQLLARELEQGTLFDLDSINLGFVRPRRPQDRGLAYAQGHWMVQYMNERFGPDALVRLLDQYFRGVPESRAMPEALGVSRDEFLAGFLSWARDDVRRWGLAPEPSFQTLLEARPESDPSAARAAAERRAEALAETAERLAGQIGLPGNAKEDRLRGGDWPRAKRAPTEIDDATVAEWLAAHGDHPDVLELALRRALKRLDGKPLDADTRSLLTRYQAARPVDPFPHRVLAKELLGSADPTLALPHLRELDAREEYDNAYALEVARLSRVAGDLAGAEAAAERAVRIAPYDAAVRELAAAIAVEAGDLPRARRHIAALKSLEPDQPRHDERLRRIDGLLTPGR